MWFQFKFVISDYNWLDKDLSKAWFSELTSDYIIYDKFHRFEESNKVIRQKNVGQNVYDMFDFIVNNYENLPEKIFFCRSCITFPKGRPRPKSNGNCSLEEIRRLISKDGLVEVHDYNYLEKYLALSKKFKYLKNEDRFILKPNINLNFKDAVATTPHQTNGNVTGGGDGYLTGSVRGQVGAPNQSMSGGRFSKDVMEIAIDAENMIHLSLSEGLDGNFPFGNSLLESIFKVYKQKELLEDAIIIYRVQRAPERRVFYVDVGNMPSHLAMQLSLIHI